MGIIDDYYGGYDNLAMYTNSDGEVDYEGAMYGGMPFGFGDDDSDDYYDSEDDGLPPFMPIAMPDGSVIFMDPRAAAAGFNLGGRGPHPNLSHGQDAAVLNLADNPTARKMLKAIIQGRFSYSGLQQVPEFQAAVRGHRESQAEAGGNVVDIEYDYEERQSKQGPEDPIPVITDLKAMGELPKGLKFDVEWWEERNGTIHTVKNIPLIPLHKSKDKKAQSKDFFGPYYTGWCSKSPNFPKTLINNPNSGMHTDIFWSAAIWWRELKTTGLELWDEQLEELCMDIEMLDQPLPIEPVMYEEYQKAHRGASTASGRRNNGTNNNPSRLALEGGRGAGGPYTTGAGAGRGRGQGKGSGSGVGGQGAEGSGGQGRGKNWKKNQKRKEKERAKKAAGGGAGGDGKSEGAA